MNITFLIGNGFDLNLGLNTRYTDVYKEYVKEESSNEVIRKFKEDLKKDEMNNFENWSDFEIGMAKYSDNFQSSKDFLKCLRDFKIFLAKYLDSENEKFINSPIIDKCVKIFIESLYSYSDGFVENVRHNLAKPRESKYYNFISFNYTYSLDKIIMELWKTDDRYKQICKLPLHIHGDCESDIALGVDNAEQIENEEFRDIKNVRRSFIKPEYNNTINYLRPTRAKDLITNSDIICSFGVSFGLSDRTWVEAIKSWLGEKSHRQFIYYCYPSLKCSIVNPDEGLELEEDEKEKLKIKFGFTDSEWSLIERQIHIPVNFSAFDFTGIEDDIDTLAYL